MRDVQHGITQVTSGADLFLDEFATMARASGHPVSWTALLTGFDGVSQFTGPGAGPEVVERNAALDADVWPQICPAISAAARSMRSRTTVQAAGCSGIPDSLMWGST